MSKVRHATIEDFPAVCEMARKFHAHTEYSRIPFDDASCYLMFMGALEKGMVFVSESQQLTGFIAGLPFPCPLNQSVTMVSELAWWVEPEYRNTGASIRLYQALQRAAESYGALSLTMICLESIEPEKVQSIYERMGHTKTESSFVRFF